jgi:hypothetical protein
VTRPEVVPRCPPEERQDKVEERRNLDELLSIMLNPLPILYPSARWWMLRSFLRMISAGLVRVSL